jgi:ribonuclease HI
MESWLQNKSAPKCLPAIISWFLWLEHNKSLFEGVKPSISVVIHRTLNILTYNHYDRSLSTLRLSTFARMDGFALAFFDGASINDGATCGAGGTIKIFPDADIRWFFNAGAGSNTKAELIGVWATLFLAKHLDIHHLQTLGDSKVVIGWMQRKNRLMAIQIEGWKRKIRTLEGNFQEISYQHIFRNSNEEADNLSKRAPLSSKGSLFFFHLGWRKRRPSYFFKNFLNCEECPLPLCLQFFILLNLS